MSKENGGWIGVDLDGTLAGYRDFISYTDIGAPVPAMVERVKRWRADGWRVKIFTARVAPDGPTEYDKQNAAAAHEAVRLWCLANLGFSLEITCVKDGKMDELWDDRAVCVEPNTGVILSPLPSRRGLS